MRTPTEHIGYVILIVGCVAAIVWLPMSPWSNDPIIVKPPASALAPELAALSGVWEAQDGRPTTIVVENIDETWAMIVNIGAQNRWERGVAHVQPDGTVRWGYPERFSLARTGAGAVLERCVPGLTERIALRKVQLPHTVGLFTVEADDRATAPRVAEATTM